MNILDGVRNFLEILNAHWTTILVVLGLIITLVKKTLQYFSKTDEERIAIAKEQIAQKMLKLIGDAEEDYENWKKAGELKRSQVIGEIFDTYPILSKVTDQKELVKWIDNTIDDSLKTLRKIVEENKNK